MAKSTATATVDEATPEVTDSVNTDTDTDEDEDEVIARTEPMDVTDNKLASALLAAWRGAYHFFKARLTPTDEFPTGWEITPEGNLIAHGLTVKQGLNPDDILRDIASRDRRVDFGPAYLAVAQGIEPEPYTDPQEMTNFSVNFLKGSGPDGNSKTPEYVRKAIADYKSEIGLKGRRGRKRTILRLDQMDNLDAETLANVKPEDLEHLIQIARQAQARNAATAVPTNA